MNRFAAIASPISAVAIWVASMTRSADAGASRPPSAVRTAEMMSAAGNCMSGTGGERAGHRFVTVEHHVTAAFADFRQRPVIVDHHHVAAEHEVGFTCGDAHRVDVFGFGGDADVRW